MMTAEQRAKAVSDFEAKLCHMDNIIDIDHLAILLLDDEHGINSDAWNYLRPFLKPETKYSARCQDGRYYSVTTSLEKVITKYHTKFPDGRYYAISELLEKVAW